MNISELLKTRDLVFKQHYQWSISLRENTGAEHALFWGRWTLVHRRKTLAQSPTEEQFWVRTENIFIAENDHWQKWLYINPKNMLKDQMCHWGNISWVTLDHRSRYSCIHSGCTERLPVHSSPCCASVWEQVFLCKTHLLTPVWENKTGLHPFPTPVQFSINKQKLYRGLSPGVWETQYSLPLKEQSFPGVMQRVMFGKLAVELTNINNLAAKSSHWV